MNPDASLQPAESHEWAMGIWWRRLHMVMMIGGGFAGLVITSHGFANQQKFDTVFASMCIAASIIFAYFIFAGVAIAENPKNLIHLLVAYGIQVFWLFSPLFGMQFLVGGGLVLGFKGHDIFFTKSFGVAWQINVLNDERTGLGINLVALFLFLMVLGAYTTARRSRESRSSY